VREPPRLRGGLVARLAVLVAGFWILAAGIVAFLESGLGLAPWDVLHQGIAEHTPLSFGLASVAVGLVAVATAWVAGARIGVGTIANAALVGVFVDVLESVDAVADLSDSPLAARTALLAVGIVSVALGSGLYLGAQLGAGPRDSLMVVGAARTRLRLGTVRTLLELSAIVTGIALGGTVGVGTLAFALLVGPSVEITFRALRASPLSAPATA
jgi:uncharacterized membrane protein YczE